MSSVFGEIFVKNKIAEFRKICKLTQPQLAEILGYKNYQALQVIERGVNIPSVDTAIRIAKALNTTVEELFILDDVQPVKPDLERIYNTDD